jgi:glyoxylase-like metal-dependent hydrolase (beta-lactamase superfamily II)
MQFGDLNIEIVTDGMVMVDAGGPFGLVPRPLYQSYINPDEDNLIPMRLDCLLVRSAGKTIVIDTGLGERLKDRAKQYWGLTRPEGGLVENLAQHSVAPEDVDIVINTHLHSDHCGGNTRFRDQSVVPTFPNAEYWVQWTEYADASHPDARTRGTYLSDNFAPLASEGRLRLLRGDVDVTPEVRCVVTPGHTRGHQSVVLQANGWTGLYPADMATFAIHLARSAWVTSYDVLPLENIATKTQWQHWAVEHQAWIFMEHDPRHQVVQLIERDGRVDLEPIGDESRSKP